MKQFKSPKLQHIEHQGWHVWKLLCVAFALSFCAVSQTIAQGKQMVQVKTFDQSLAPYMNIDVSVNGKDFFSVGSKGVAFIELLESDFPLKSIKVKDEKLEAASWNYSKGIIEVIIRTRSYHMVSIIVRATDGTPLSNQKVSFLGKTVTTSQSDHDGRFEVPLGLDEQIVSPEQFAIANFRVIAIEQAGSGPIVTVEPIPLEPEEPVTRVQAPGYFTDFDLSKLDSIQSLTAFYAIFKKFPIKDMSDQAKRRIDAKFHELVLQLQDSITSDDRSAMGKISDSSFVDDDIKSLLSQATQESQVLDLQRAEFDEKISIIQNKLAEGISTMDERTRANLLSDLMKLEALLTQNESRFYQNQGDYRQLINSLKEKYFDIADLENRLSQSEAQRLEEQRAFRQKLFVTLGILCVFALLILLLVYFGDKLKKQKKELERVNGEINRINENLESLVAQRTRLLEDANKELDTFLYRASHDLRSPVCSIIGLCNIALHTSDGESKDLVQKVVFTTAIMDKLLKKLSIISEINQPTNFSSITLVDLIDSVKGLFEEAVVNQKITLVTECPADLVIYSYPNLIETILVNLLENAFFFSGMKDPENIRVEVKATIINDMVVISVHDNGIGIDDAISPRLFDMFFKGTEHSKGSGLGLYIVQKAVQALEGEIHVESVAGEFTKFIVHVPLKPLTFGTLSRPAIVLPVEESFG
jgi:signal transduction histidine kinase